MGLEIKDPKGNTKIRIDDADQKKDVVVEDGKEIPYDEAAAAKVAEVKDEVKPKPEEEKEEGKKDEEGTVAA